MATRPKNPTIPHPDQRIMGLAGSPTRTVTNYRLPLMGIRGIEEQPEDGTIRLIDALFVDMIAGDRRANAAKGKAS